MKSDYEDLYQEGTVIVNCPICNKLTTKTNVSNFDKDNLFNKYTCPKEKCVNFKIDNCDNCIRSEFLEDFYEGN